MLEHKKYQLLISSYFDGELTEEEQKNLFQHLEFCPECRQEFEKTQKFEEAMKGMRLKNLPQEAWSMYWTSVYNRLERGIGWILLSLGGIILLFFGGYKMVEGIIKNPENPFVLKLGLLTVLAGAVILLVSFPFILWAKRSARNRQ
ncbi:MAG: anti-sigma factor family protein [Acidobacteriota bacterium]